MLLHGSAFILIPRMYVHTHQNKHFSLNDKLLEDLNWNNNFFVNFSLHLIHLKSLNVIYFSATKRKPKNKNPVFTYLELESFRLQKTNN